MLNVTNHQGNALQNRNEISPHARQNGYNWERQEITSVGQDVEKREAYSTAGGPVNWYRHYGKQYEDSSKN